MKWTVTAGELLQIISFIITMFAVYNRISIEIAEIKTELSSIKRWWETCTEGNCPMAKELKELSQEQRMTRKYQVE